ncbi:MAG TPA: GyrI-like domain-containing protein, partial [Chitinophagales bacterium]|nr:GyrI-like domain-containing protein [Chitinophagales bacterium]
MSDHFLRMEELPSLQLAAKGITMTMAENRTVELWQSAKPIMMRMQGRRPGFISMEVFPEGINFENFTPRTPFQKWAAVQLDEGAAVPEGLEAYSLQGG